MANLSYEDRKAIDKYLLENPSIATGSEWGDIVGNIENQTDLINYINDNAGGTDIELNPVENDYADNSAMVSDQLNQTTNFFQYVEDAGGGDEAYYEKLESSNGVIEDYRKLDSGEVVILNNNNSFKTFKISAAAQFVTSTVGGGKVAIEYDAVTDKIVSFTFNKRYSSIIENIISLYSEFDYAIKIYSQNKRKYHLAKVDSFINLSGGYVNMTIEDTIDYSNNFDIDDKLQFEFDIDAAGGETGEGNAIAEFYQYSFRSGQDNIDFFNDGLIKLSWDAPANDLELYMLTEPNGTGDMISLATKGDNTPVSTYITQPNFKYDVYPLGVNATEGLIVWISAEEDNLFPSYKVFVHNAGSSYNSNVEVKKVIPKTII